MDNRENIDRLLRDHGFQLGKDAVDRVDQYCKELERWNGKVNLTTITKLEDVVVLHFADSFKLGEYLEGSEKVLDIGSGAGFPGLALKIICPEIDLCSVEKVSKKQVFQKNISVKLGLTKVVFAQSRVEDLAKQTVMAGAFDVVVSRAWTEPLGLLASAKIFLKPGGRVLAMTGVLSEAEEAQLPGLAAELGYDVLSQSQYRLPGAKKEHVIRVLRAC